MRPPYLLIGILTIGSASAGLGPAGIKALPDHMVRAARAISGRDAADSKPVPVAAHDLAGVRDAYDTVTERLTQPVDLGLQPSGAPGAERMALQQPLPKVNSVPAPVSNVAAQIRQFDDHMQDLRAYGRTPAGWHGDPPR